MLPRIVNEFVDKAKLEHCSEEVIKAVVETLEAEFNTAWSAVMPEDNVKTLRDVSAEDLKSALKTLEGTKKYRLVLRAQIIRPETAVTFAPLHPVGPGFFANLLEAREKQARANFKRWRQGLVDPTLNLIVTKVHCKDETGRPWLGGEAGSDDMRVAVVSVSGSGRTVKHGEVNLGQYNDRTTRRPNMDVAALNVFSDYDDPYLAFHYDRVYTFIATLVEKDQGGFGDFMSTLWSRVGSAVTRALANAGAAVGSAILPGIGTVIGAAVGQVLGWLIGAIISSFRDDIFPPKQFQVTLPSGQTFGPGFSPVNLNFRGHRGEYEVTFGWDMPN